jgi:hypothetical protein
MRSAPASSILPFDSVVFLVEDAIAITPAAKMGPQWRADFLFSILMSIRVALVFSIAQ